MDISSWVDERDERTLYVTAEEFGDIQQYAAPLLSDETPEVRAMRREAALQRGERDFFLGLPLIVDDVEAERQRREWNGGG